MKDFQSLRKFTLADIQSLIDNEVEENLYLDYKSGEALKKNDSGKNEITKDVSSFANSDGGIIIYGVKEVNHKPSEISPVNGNDFTKERLEQIIANIQPHIKGISIHAIRINSDVSKSIYIVKIPRSTITPHMATDHRYYKRNNFQSIAMEDYEIKDLFYRHNLSKLIIDDCSLNILSSNSKKTVYQFGSKIYNDSNTVETLYKLNCYINGNIKNYNYIEEDKGNFTILDKDRLKISFTGKEPIFAYECLDMARFKIGVPYDCVDDFERNASIELILFYENKIDEYSISVRKLLTK